MASCCNYCMRVTGNKDECNEFYKILNNEGKRYFDRVYKAIIQSEGYRHGCYYMEISGGCAWSVNTSMDGGNGSPNQFTTLEQESRRLNLMIEVFSTEPGEELAEHILYVDGDLIEDECVEYSEFYWDQCDYPTIEELNAAYGTSYAEEDFDSDGYHVEGGFGDWIFRQKKG